MTSRAASANATADRILDAALARYATTPYDRIRLEDVAADAEVTVQTVIRRFGGKAGLVVALAERELGRIGDTRAAARGAPVRETLHALVAHYEAYGELILKVYAEAHLIDGLPAVAARGRAFHVDWCRRTFSDAVRARGGTKSDVARHLAEIIAICDATTWRILRQDGDLSAKQVEQALCELVSVALGTRE